MSPDAASRLFSGVLIDSLIVASPLLLITLLIGVFISVVQVVTQIQEMSLTFIPKIVGAVLVLLVFGPWMLKYVSSAAIRLITSIPSTL